MECLEPLFGSGSIVVVPPVAFVGVLVLQRIRIIIIGIVCTLSLVFITPFFAYCIVSRLICRLVFIGSFTQLFFIQNREETSVK